MLAAWLSVAHNRDMQLNGVWTALVTPFQDGSVDTSAMERLVHYQIAAEVTGVVPVGTTGESPTLSHEEHLRVIELVVELVNKKIPVMAGTGSNCTAEAIELSQGAERVGVQALLLVAPYYNKPTQEGLYQHFTAIANATELPIVLYSIPSRCGVEIAVETVARLAQANKNIIGIKEAGGRVERVQQIKAACPDGFQILSGDDALTLDFIEQGACGVVSVASNLIPGEIVHYVRLALNGQLAEARELEKSMATLFKDLFIETNPVPVKTALAAKGVCREEVRLPLVSLAPENKEKLLNTLRSGGWI